MHPKLVSFDIIPPPPPKKKKKKDKKMQSAFGYRLRNKLYSNMKSHNFIWIMNLYNFNYMTIEFSLFKLLKRSVELFIVIYEFPFCQNMEGRDLCHTLKYSLYLRDY